MSSVQSKRTHNPYLFSRVDSPPYTGGICLFINVDGCDYSNTFQKTENGCEVSWFAQSRMTLDSPVLVRMQKKHFIVLFLREKGKHYLCLGQVDFLSCVESSPIKVQLSIKHHSELMQYEEYKAMLSL